MANTPAPTPWWEIMELRPEIAASGTIGDVQISLHNAVFGVSGNPEDATPYASAAYYGAITHPTASLVELMARIAIRLGTPQSDQSPPVWRLDQAMGGGKSHCLVGLWHLATSAAELATTDLGQQVVAEAAEIAGRGTLPADLDLGSPLCVVLDCDNTTPTEEDFGPAKSLGAC